jgi:hypothetical protein
VGNHEGRSPAADGKGYSQIEVNAGGACGRPGLPADGGASSCAGRRRRAGSAGQRLGLHARGHVAPFYGGARGARQPGAASPWPAWPMGLAAGPERVGSGHRLGPIR